MVKHTLILICALFVSIASASAKDKPPTALDAVTAEAVIDHVLPNKRDLLWTQVPWRPTLWDAVIDAHKEKKPILLWAMNGHALACT